MSAKGTAQPGFFRLKEQSQRKKASTIALNPSPLLLSPRFVSASPASSKSERLFSFCSAPLMRESSPQLPFPPRRPHSAWLSSPAPDFPAPRQGRLNQTGSGTAQIAFITCFLRDRGKRRIDNELHI
jgi:hypothetical protein